MFTASGRPPGYGGVYWQCPNLKAPARAFKFCFLVTVAVAAIIMMMFRTCIFCHGRHISLKGPEPNRAFSSLSLVAHSSSTLKGISESAVPVRPGPASLHLSTSESATRPHLVALARALPVL